MKTKLKQRLAAIEGSLTLEEKSQLSDMEKAAMTSETNELLQKARMRQRGMEMSRSKVAQAKPQDPKIAQAPMPSPSPPPMPTSGVPITGQGDDMDLSAPPTPGAPPVVADSYTWEKAPVGCPLHPHMDIACPDCAAMGVQPPLGAPPVVAQPLPGPETVTPDMGAQPPMVAAKPPTTIEQYTEEKELEDRPMTDDELGIKAQASYVGVYGHLKIRPTAQRDLEVFDPGSNKVLITVRPNQSTKRSANKLRACALEVLWTIAKSGLTKTAQLWKAQVRTADGGIVDYGDNVMKTKPNYTQDQSLEARGDDVMSNEDMDANGVRSTTSEGETTDRKQPHPTRKAPGLGGTVERTAQNDPMSATGPQKLEDGTLDGRVTNMSDEVHQVEPGKALNSTNMYESNMRDDREPYTRGKGVLEDEC